MIIENTTKGLIVILNQRDFYFKQSDDDIEFKINKDVEMEIIRIIQSQFPDRLK